MISESFGILIESNLNMCDREALLLDSVLQIDHEERTVVATILSTLRNIAESVIESSRGKTVDNVDDDFEV